MRILRLLYARFLVLFCLFLLPFCLYFRLAVSHFLFFFLAFCSSYSLTAVAKSISFRFPFVAR